MRDFKNIKAWQHADKLAILIYKRTRSFPKEELYGITSQLRRAAISAPTNIAEGASREHKNEYLQFLFIARGSLYESNYLLHVSRRLGFLTENNYRELINLLEEATKTLHGLIKSVKQESPRYSKVYGLKSKV